MADVSKEIANAVAAACEGLGFLFFDCGDGCYEIEQATLGTGYDFCEMLDMRGRPEDDPAQWVAEARALYEAFDPREEAEKWLDGPGAPPFDEMVDDFEDFKSTVLADLPAAVERAVAPFAK